MGKPLRTLLGLLALTLALSGCVTLTRVPFTQAEVASPPDLSSPPARRLP